MNEVEYPEPRKKTLLYLEDRLVNQNGKLEARRMNDGDFANIEEMEEEGLLEVERIKSDKMKELQTSSWKPTHKVTKFTDEAWKQAHKHRKERGKI